MLSTAIIVLSVVSSLLMSADVTPESKPDPYADLGMICIVLVLLQSVGMAMKQVYQFYFRRRNSLKEKV